MKVHRVSAVKVFEPIKLEVVIESNAELRALRLANSELCVGTVQKDVPEWADAQHIVSLLEKLYEKARAG